MQSDRYHVEYLPIGKIKPSPENDQVYGDIEHDEQMQNLIGSIRRKGLEEPLILTGDNYVLSGHRRLYAIKWLDWKEVPCRIRGDILRRDCADFHRELIEYNPQRIKRAGSLLKEALLRDCGADTHAAIEDYDYASADVDADFMVVDGDKNVEPISTTKQEFLAAVKGVIEELRSYWPLSIRQIHYRLLNDPPLTLTPKRSKFDPEHYRYQQSSIQNVGHPEAEALFAHYPMRRLEAEVLEDALCRIFNVDVAYRSDIPEPFTFIPPGQSTVSLADSSISSPFLKTFGRPSRDRGFEFDRKNDITEAHRLFFINSTELNGWIQGSWWLRKLPLATGAKDTASIRLLWLSILSRYPTASELQTVQEFYQSKPNREIEATQDLVWALISIKEFSCRH